VLLLIFTIVCIGYGTNLDKVNRPEYNKRALNLTEQNNIFYEQKLTNLKNNIGKMLEGITRY
jgi:hypothetical protein